MYNIDPFVGEFYLFAHVWRWRRSYKSHATLEIVYIDFYFRTELSIDKSICYRSLSRILFCLHRESHSLLAVSMRLYHHKISFSHAAQLLSPRNLSPFRKACCYPIMCLLDFLQTKFRNLFSIHLVDFPILRQ